MGLSPELLSAGNRLADAVAVDVADAFARFEAARGDDTVVGFALCSVDDAAPPYIMGATLEDIGPIEGTERTWRADPADWSWSDEGHRYRCEAIISEMDCRAPAWCTAADLPLLTIVHGGFQAL